MKTLLFALVAVPFVAIAAPSQQPKLQLSDAQLVASVPRTSAAGCPARVAIVSLVEVGRPETFWSSYRTAVPVEHKQTGTCTAVVGPEQLAGRLRDGQSLIAQVSIGSHKSASLALTAECSDSTCHLVERSQSPFVDHPLVGEDIKVAN